jgi:hypothetical protein
MKRDRNGSSLAIGRKKRKKFFASKGERGRVDLSPAISNE